MYWSWALACALCGSGWLANQLWVRFMELPTRTVVKNSQAPASSMPLPAFTLCHQADRQPYRDTLLDHIMIPRALTRELVERAVRDTPLLVADYSELTVLNDSLLAVLDTVLDLNRITFREYVSRLVPPCEKLLKKCWLHGEPAPCADLFRRTHGRCCSFNTPAPGEKYEPFYPGESTGMMGGLSVVVSGEYGGEMRFAVHHSLTYPEFDQGGHAVQRGRQVFLGLQPFEVDCLDEVRHLSEQVRGCVFEEERSLRFFDEYSFQNCPIECRMNASLALCDCISYSYPAPEHLVCNASQLPCLRRHSFLNKNYGLRYNPESSLVAEEAVRRKGLEMNLECPVNCDYWEYRVVDLISFRLDVPHADFTGFYADVDTRLDGVVHVFFPSPHYVLQEILLVADQVTLLSSLGGVFGLFLGCSIITLTEVVFELWRRLLLPAGRRALRACAGAAPRPKPTREHFRKVHLTIVGPALFGDAGAGAGAAAGVDASSFYIRDEMLGALHSSSDLYVRK